MGIGNGASILVSQEMGRRNADGLRMLVRTTVWFLYLCAIPVTILAMFVGPALLRLMQVPADAFDYAVLYLRITALGTLGNLGYNMNAGILRGLGDSRSTLLLLLISCLTNIVLDVAFVAVLGMGVAGAALATTIALYLSWLASILYARRNYEGLQFPLLPHGYDKAQLATILKVGVPLGLNNSLYSVGHVAVQAVYNMQGSVFVAGCSIAGRVTGIAGIAITSFSSAAVVFAGESRNPDEAAAMIREACRKLHETGVTPEQFSWAKKAVYGRTLAMLNNTESIANAMVSQYFAGYSLFDYIDRAAEVTLEQVNARLEEQLDDSRCALAVILPQE